MRKIIIKFNCCPIFKRYSSYVATTKKKTLYPGDHLLEDSFILEYLFRSFKDQSSHTYDTLLRKWIINPLHYGENLSKIALNIYHNKIRHLKDEEVDSFNRAFSNENFVKEALALRLKNKDFKLEKYYQVRNYSCALKEISYGENISNVIREHNLNQKINTSKWMNFYRFYTEDDLRFMYSVDVSQIKNLDGLNKEKLKFRHQVPMPEPFETLRQYCAQKLAKYFEIRIENRIKIDESDLTFFDLFHSTDTKLLSLLIIDGILWDICHKGPQYCDQIGWDLSNNLAKIILTNFNYESGNTPILFEIGKHYYQNFRLKASSQTYREFYQRISRQIDQHGITHESISYLPIKIGLKLSSLILHKVIGNHFKYSNNMRIFERISNHPSNNYYFLKNIIGNYVRINPNLVAYLKRQSKSAPNPCIYKDNRANEMIYLSDNNFFVSLDKLPQLIPNMPYISPMLSSGLIFTRNYPVSNVYEPVLFRRYHEKSIHYPHYKYIDVLNVLNNIPMQFNPTIIRAIDKADFRWWKSFGITNSCSTITTDQVMGLFTPENGDQQDDPDFLRHCLAMAQQYYQLVNSASSALQYNKRSIEIAKQFGHATPFYINYKCDYRGRYYPTSYLHHHRTDIIRSLFQFHEKKVVDESGLRSLKIHLYITKYGRDRTGKMSLDDYVNFIDKHLDNVIDSANNYHQCDWWKQENIHKCWQVLATCSEIRNVLASDGEYKSGYPVKVDIAATLITHLCLLLKDENLARMSSLSKIFFQNTSNDIYEYLTTKVKALLHQSSSQNFEFFYNLFPHLIDKNILSASSLKPLIIRNILSPLSQRTNPNSNLNDFNNFIKDNPQFMNLNRSLFYELDIAINRAIFDQNLSRITAFKGWLVDIASSICDDGRFPCWFSPCGLHVMPIFVQKQIDKSGLDWITCHRDINDCTDIRKQGLSPTKYKYVNSFLPNLIDCIDSSLFANVVLACEKENITIMGVHDSYWTHPCDVNRLQQIVKEQLFELYKEPILERFYEDLNENLSPKAKYKVALFKDIGNLDLSALINSNEYICL